MEPSPNSFQFSFHLLACAVSRAFAPRACATCRRSAPTSLITLNDNAYPHDLLPNGKRKMKYIPHAFDHNRRDNLACAKRWQQDMRKSDIALARYLKLCAAMMQDDPHAHWKKALWPMFAYSMLGADHRGYNPMQSSGDTYMQGTAARVYTRTIHELVCQPHDQRINDFSSSVFYFIEFLLFSRHVLSARVVCNAVLPFISVPISIAWPPSALEVAACMAGSTDGFKFVRAHPAIQSTTDSAQLLPSCAHWASYGARTRDRVALVQLVFSLLRASNCDVRAQDAATTVGMKGCVAFCNLAGLHRVLRDTPAVMQSCMSNDQFIRALVFYQPFNAKALFREGMQ